jgi:hypothetical protein
MVFETHLGSLSTTAVVPRFHHLLEWHDSMSPSWPRIFELQGSSQGSKKQRAMGAPDAPKSDRGLEPLVPGAKAVCINQGCPSNPLLGSGGLTFTTKQKYLHLRLFARNAT